MINHGQVKYHMKLAQDSKRICELRIMKANVSLKQAFTVDAV